MSTIVVGDTVVVDGSFEVATVLAISECGAHAVTTAGVFELDVLQKDDASA